MKYLITESRLLRLAQNFLDYYLENVRAIHPMGTSDNYVQFVDQNDNIVMDGMIDQELLVNYKLWDHLKDNFLLSDELVVKILETWIETNFGFSFGDDYVRDVVS